MRIKPTSLFMSAAFATSLMLPLAVSAHGMNGTKPFDFKQSVAQGIQRLKSFIFGTVSSINGNNLVVVSSGMHGSATTTYQVDASQVTSTKPGVGLTIANIQVGDKVMIKGSTSGTAVTAKKITDISFYGRNVFNGSVTAVSGTTLTLKSKDNVTYTVNAASAAITKGHGSSATSGTIADITTGDRITITGTLSGSTITATAIQEGGAFKGMPHKGMSKGGFHGFGGKGFGGMHR